MTSYTEAFSDKNILIGISGIIGAGKSTLTSQLAKELEYDEVKEPVVHNPYLDLFYGDMHKYAFPMQIYLLNERFRQHQSMVWGNKSAVQDRTIYEDVIFAKMLNESGHMSDLDFETYRATFRNMNNFLHRPDIFIYLDVEPEIAKERIAARGRECEKEIPLSYLAALKKGYEDWLKDIEGRIPVIRIDWNKFKNVNEVIDMIKPKIKRPLITF